MGLLPSPHARKRLLVFAAVAFFLSSAYLCATRLFVMDFTRGALGLASLMGGRHHHGYETQDSAADLPMSYGEYDRPSIDGITLFDALPEEYVPTPDNGRRLVIVGDIHGMDKPLARLLRKVDFDEHTDHLIATGDMINKGPDSPGVIDRLMRLNASAVRGNHEDRVLLSVRELEERDGAAAELSSPGAERRRGQSRALRTARRLSRDQLRWLSALPVILTVDPLSIYVVHAGLVPGVRVDKQDPWAVMNMRTLVYPREELRKKEEQSARAVRDTSAIRHDEAQDVDVDDEESDIEYQDLYAAPDPFSDRAVAVPIETHKGERWADVWNRKQAKLRRRDRHTVVYGHDAKRGFREGRHTFGLDSGCVAGGALTALVVEADPRRGRGFAQKTVQVECRKKH